MERPQEHQKRQSPSPHHTNHDKIILLVGLERPVEVERLRLDSAQHGPSRGGKVSGVLAGVEGVQSRVPEHEHEHEREHGEKNPRTPARSQGPSPLTRACRKATSAPRPSPLAEPAGDLSGAQGREGSLRQESEIVAAFIPRLPSSHPAYGHRKASSSRFHSDTAVEDAPGSGCWRPLRGRGAVQGTGRCLGGGTPLRGRGLGEKWALWLSTHALCLSEYLPCY